MNRMTPRSRRYLFSKWCKSKGISITDHIPYNAPKSIIGFTQVRAMNAFRRVLLNYINS